MFIKKIVFIKKFKTHFFLYKLVSGNDKKIINILFETGESSYFESNFIHNKFQLEPSFTLTEIIVANRIIFKVKKKKKCGDRRRDGPYDGKDVLEHLLNNHTVSDGG